jgi:hypothetical protein
MRNTKHIVALALAPLLFAATVTAQVGVSGHIGTLGVGADLGIGVSRMIGLRAGVNVQPWEPKQTFEDVEFTLDLASPSYMAVIDLHPAGGSFRVTGGAVYFSREHEIRGTPTESIDIGGQSYSPTEIGTLAGTFDTKGVAPYAGIGFGRIAGRRGVGFTLDLGVAFQGEPAVSLTASGPIASQPVFQANLAEEEQNIAEDAKAFRFYPVLTIGLAIGF